MSKINPMILELINELNISVNEKNFLIKSLELEYEYNDKGKQHLKKKYIANIEELGVNHDY
jgi:hypothetical protein